jgi:hypothetical protein
MGDEGGTMIKQALAAAAVAAALLAATAQANWQPAPGGAQGAVDPGGGGAGTLVQPVPDALDRAVANLKASKATKSSRPAPKRPLLPDDEPIAQP